jgi:hypothetical protein
MAHLLIRIHPRMYRLLNLGCTMRPSATDVTTQEVDPLGTAYDYVGLKTETESMKAPQTVTILA